MFNHHDLSIDYNDHDYVFSIIQKPLPPYYLEDTCPLKNILLLLRKVFPKNKM